MATMQNVQTVGIESGADLSADANQYKFVKLNAGKVELAGLGDQAIGVLLNKPKLGDQAEVGIGGIVKVQADAAFAVDVKLMSSADGQAALAVAAAGRHVLAIAMQAASAAGEIVKVLLVAKPILA